MEYSADSEKLYSLYETVGDWQRIQARSEESNVTVTKISSKRYGKTRKRETATGLSPLQYYIISKKNQHDATYTTNIYSKEIS